MLGQPQQLDKFSMLLRRQGLDQTVDEDLCGRDSCYFNFAVADLLTQSVTMNVYVPESCSEFWSDECSDCLHVVALNQRNMIRLKIDLIE